MIKIIQRKDVVMPRVFQIRIVRSSSGVYEVDANEVDADVYRDASADCGCCCDGHCNLAHLPVIEIADMNPFSTLMSGDVILNFYPEPEDDDVSDDVPPPRRG